MLISAFSSVYTKFKLTFYSKIFSNLEENKESLTTIETCCVETIYALKRPTINEFSTFLKISPPNAAYKINRLIRKGYIKKVQSTTDKREYYLEVTEKFLKCYNFSSDYVETIVERVMNRFPEKDLQKFEYMLNVIADELMTEVKLDSSSND
ncbi:MAG: MarR family transcriptional regulator [Oscillospiraceae bacterium]